VLRRFVKQRWSKDFEFRVVHLGSEAYSEFGDASSLWVGMQMLGHSEVPSDLVQSRALSALLQQLLAGGQVVMEDTGQLLNVCYLC